MVSADKAYASIARHRAILATQATPVIPPRTGAAITPPAAIAVRCINTFTAIGMPRAKVLLADRSHDADLFRNALIDKGITP